MRWSVERERLANNGIKCWGHWVGDSEDDRMDAADAVKLFNEVKHDFPQERFRLVLIMADSQTDT